MKSELLLTLYDALLGGTAVKRKDFCAAYGVSERTFYRYMRGISMFLRKYKPQTVIDVREPTGEYFLREIGQ